VLNCKGRRVEIFDIVIPEEKLKQIRWFQALRPNTWRTVEYMGLIRYHLLFRGTSGILLVIATILMKKPQQKFDSIFIF
jgi:hypothetical protein